VFDEAAALRPWTEKRRDIEVGAGLSHLAEMKGWLVKSWTRPSPAPAQPALSFS